MPTSGVGCDIKQAWEANRRCICQGIHRTGNPRQANYVFVESGRRGASRALQVEGGRERDACGHSKADGIDRHDIRHEDPQEHEERLRSAADACASR